MTRLVIILTSLAMLPTLCEGQYRQSYGSGYYSSGYYPSYYSSYYPTSYYNSGYYSPSYYSGYSSYPSGWYQYSDGYYYYGNGSTPYIRDYYGNYVPYAGYSSSGDAKTQIVRAGIALAKQQQDQKDLEATIRQFPALQTMPQGFSSGVTVGGMYGYGGLPFNASTVYGYTPGQTYNQQMNQILAQALNGSTGDSESAQNAQLAGQAMEYAKLVTIKNSELQLAKNASRERIVKRFLTNQDILAAHDRSIRAILSPDLPTSVQVPVPTVVKPNAEKLPDPQVDGTQSQQVRVPDENAYLFADVMTASCAACHFSNNLGEGLNGPGSKGVVRGKLNFAQNGVNGIDFIGMTLAQRQSILDRIDPANPKRDMPRVVGDESKIGEAITPAAFEAFKKAAWKQKG